MEKILSDGYADFSGGMDSTRGAALLGKNQFVWSTNCRISKDRDGLSCRYGYRPVELIFNLKEDESIFNEGDYQGDGSYYDGYYQETIILVSISGYIFQLREVGRYKYQVSILNKSSQNNPDNISCYITSVKNSALVSDGESSNIKATIGSASRVRGAKALPPCYASVYVQNRLFAIDRTRENIIASTVKNPFSIEEGLLSNIYGFTAPEDNDYITAVGRLTTLRKDVSGGNLCFSTNKNIYSVDVRGARSQWGIAGGQGTGYVENSIPDIGAVSPFSFESVNSNLYFRNQNLGVCSLKRAQSEFQGIDSYAAQSIEANKFFNNDSEIFLSQCRSKAFDKRLMTTVFPFQKNNSVLWKGLIVFYPSFYSSSREGVLPSFYESIYTGLNVHSILNVQYPDDLEDLFLFSVDSNGRNKIFVLDKSIDYDIGINGKHQEIERKILTRAFDFNNPFVEKQSKAQSYSLSEITRTTKVEIFTRPSDDGEFTLQSSRDHKVGTTIKKGVFKFSPVKKQQRYTVPIENDNSKDKVNTFFVRQDLIKLLGPANFKRWIRSVNIDTPQAIPAKNETIAQSLVFKEEKVFTYKL